jgi:hypothetical protein
VLQKAELRTVAEAVQWLELNDRRFGPERIIARLLKIIARLTRYH